MKDFTTGRAYPQLINYAIPLILGNFFHTDGQIFRYVVAPQTFRRLIPLSMNLITRMIKTTSLVVFVNVIEVIKIGQQIIEANRMKNPTAAIAVYFTIFMMYFFVCWILSLAARQIEKRQKA